MLIRKDVKQKFSIGQRVILNSKVISNAGKYYKDVWFPPCIKEYYGKVGKIYKKWNNLSRFNVYKVIFSNNEESVWVHSDFIESYKSKYML